jgi:N-acetylmuramoyl-L-alanine amidase
MYQYIQSSIFLNKRCFSIFIAIIFFQFIAADLMAQTENSYKIKTVVIDAGHGGKDPGCVYKSGKKVLGMEKDIALSVALQLGNYIKSNYKEVKVVFTRDKDEFIELHKRASIGTRIKQICLFQSM